MLVSVRLAYSNTRFTVLHCPSSYKLGHKVGLSYGGSGSSVGLIMQPACSIMRARLRAVKCPSDLPP